MLILPTYYFRSLAEPVTLSREYGLELRNAPDMGLAEANMRNVFGGLSDKEKRRILYALHPFGIPEARGTLDEIFCARLARLHVYLLGAENLPLPASAYGALCGFGGQAPLSFLVQEGDSPRLFLRALKNEIARGQGVSLAPLQGFCAALDGLLSQKNPRQWLTGVGKALASPAPAGEQAFLRQCLAAELLVSNGKDGAGPQFARKLTLLRCWALKLKGESRLVPPAETEKMFRECYRLRSGLVHGAGAPPRKTAALAAFLFHSVRLSLFALAEDPLYFLYIKNL